MRQDVVRHPVLTVVSVALLAVMVGACGDGYDDRPATGEEVEEGVADEGEEAEAAGGPPLVVTVSNGRSVQIGDSAYSDSVVHWGPPVDREGKRARVTLGAPGKSMTLVTMRAAPEDSLILVHVDASTVGDSTILVYGAYGTEMAAMSRASSPVNQAALFGMGGAKATKAGWECIWCRGGILACGIEPQCGS